MPSLKQISLSYLMSETKFKRVIMLPRYLLAFSESLITLVKLQSTSGADNVFIYISLLSVLTNNRNIKYLFFYFEFRDFRNNFYIISDFSFNRAYLFLNNKQD